MSDHITVRYTCLLQCSVEQERIHESSLLVVFKSKKKGTHLSAILDRNHITLILFHLGDGLPSSYAGVSYLKLALLSLVAVDWLPWLF